MRRVVYTTQTRIAAIRPDGTMLVNKQNFGRLPFPAKLFILAHELAHQYGIKDETEADIFAAKCMRDMGYTDREIALAQGLTLRVDPANTNNARIAALLAFLIPGVPPL